MFCVLVSIEGWGASRWAEGSPSGEVEGLEACEALAASRLAEKETAACFYDLTWGDVTEGQSEMAGRALSRLAAQHPDLPWFTYYAANRLYSADPSSAETLYRRCAERFHSSGEIEGEVHSRINRSKLLRRLGREEEARQEVERVFESTKESRDPDLRAWGQLELARQLLRSGQNLGRAYKLVRDLSASASSDESYSMRRDRLLLLGNVCVQIGRIDEALSAFRAVAEMAAEAKEAFPEASARYDLAWAAFERLSESPTAAHLEETRALAASALEAATSADHRTAEAKAAWMLGVVAPEAERSRYFERCLQAAPTPDLQSYCLGALATWQLRSDPKGATRSVARALMLARESEDLWWRIFAWRASMRVQWAVAGTRSALVSSNQALDALEMLRDRQTEGSAAQAGVFSVWSDDYAWLAGRLFGVAEASGDPEWALAQSFRVAERVRARALTDWLRVAGPQASRSQGRRFARLVEVRAALAPDEALLSFQVAPWEDLSGDFGGGSWVMAITRDGVSVHQLPGRVEVRRDVQIFEGLVEARSGAEAGPAARLYEKLLAPALADLPAAVTRLVLVPDDALHRLPFAALRAAADAPPLGDRFELVQVPSATLWLDWRREREAPPARPLLVLADPDVAAGEAEPDADEAPVKVAQVRDAASGLGRLPHARAEGRAAVKALGGGLLLMGAEASEAQVATLPLGDFGLVHFAAHAITDEDRPERSAVLLAPGAAGYDGRLESAEIAGLHLEGRTVVLASCRSASGSVLRGEGVMSLARAFFQAGAHGVVASLWPLRDDESAALFDRFYRHLAGGESVAAALHGARADAIEAGEPAAAWAGLVVLGDGSVVPVPGGRASAGWSRAGWAALWLLLALALAAGAVAAWRARA
jgi:CHAT domain-containing protein